MYIAQRGPRRPGLGAYTYSFTPTQPPPPLPFQIPGFAPTLPTGPVPPNGGGGWDWLNLIPAGVEVYRQLTGGDSGGGACWTGYANRPFSEPCPGTPDYDAVVRAVARAPDIEVAKLIFYLLKANQGRGPKTRADLARPECVPFWAKAIMGGKGCVASKFPEAPEYFVQVVRDYGAPETPTEAEPGSSFFPGTPGTTAGNLVPLLAAGLAIVFLPRLLGKS